MIVVNKILEAKNTLVDKENAFVQELMFIANRDQLQDKEDHSLTPYHYIELQNKKKDHSVLEWGIKKDGWGSFLFGALGKKLGAKKVCSTRVFEDNHNNVPRWTVTTMIHDENYRDLIEKHIDDYVHNHLKELLKPHGRYIQKMN